LTIYLEKSIGFKLLLNSGFSNLDNCYLKERFTFFIGFVSANLFLVDGHPEKNNLSSYVML